MNKDQELLMKVMFDKKLKEREEEQPVIECCIDKLIKKKEDLKEIKPTSGFNAG